MEALHCVSFYGGGCRWMKNSKQCKVHGCVQTCSGEYIRFISQRSDSMTPLPSINVNGEGRYLVVAINMI